MRWRLISFPPRLPSKRCRRESISFQKGSDATAFFIVISGKVKIYKLSPDGKEHTLHIHGPGDLVAEAAIFDSMRYPASCMAMEDSQLVRISRDGFLALIRSHPELALENDERLFETIEAVCRKD